MSTSRDKFTALTIGTMSSAPEADLAKDPDSGGALRSCTTTASTPNAAAVRKIAPALCGSVIWSKTRTIRRFSDGTRTSSNVWRGSAPQDKATPWCTDPCGNSLATVLASVTSYLTRASKFAPISSTARAVSTSRLIMRFGLASAARTGCKP